MLIQNVIRAVDMVVIDGTAMGVVATLDLHRSHKRMETNAPQGKATKTYQLAGVLSRAKALQTPRCRRSASVSNTLPKPATPYVPDDQQRPLRNPIALPRC